MNIFDRLPMPNWMKVKFPKGQEGETFSQIVVPACIFPTMIIAMAWLYLFDGRLLFVWIICSLSFVLLVALFVYWLWRQVNILLRSRGEN